MALTHSSEGPWCVDVETETGGALCATCKKSHCVCVRTYDGRYEGLKSIGLPLRLYCYEAPYRTINSGGSASHGNASIAKYGNWGTRDEQRAFGFLDDVGPHLGGTRTSSCSPDLRCAYGSVTGAQANFGAECWAGKTTKHGFCPRVQAVPTKNEQRASGTAPFVESKPLAIEVVSLKRGLDILNRRRCVAKLAPLSAEVQTSMIQIVRDIYQGETAKVLVTVLPSDKAGHRQRLDDIKYREKCVLLVLPVSCREGLFRIGVLRSFWQTLIERARSEGKMSEVCRYESMSNQFAYRTAYPDGSEEPVCVDLSVEGLAAASLVIQLLPRC